MSTPFGLLVGFLAGSVTWQILARATANLPGLPSRALLAVALLAAVIGFLAGSAVWRRAQRGGSHMLVFGTLAFAFTGGIIGAVLALSLTAAYLGAYAVPGASNLFTALSYPALSFLGLCGGAIVAAPAGFLAGGALRLLHTR